MAQPVWSNYHLQKVLALCGDHTGRHAPRLPIDVGACITAGSSTLQSSGCSSWHAGHVAQQGPTKVPDIFSAVLVLKKSPFSNWAFL